MTNKSRITTGFYDSWSPVQKGKFAAMKVRAPAIMARLKKGLTLDIGCGNGYFEREFGGDFIGVDTDEKMLRGSVVVFPRILGDGRRRPFADYSFDAVVSVDTMHLVAGNDFVRVLKPGGIALLATFFNDNNYEERKAMLVDKLDGFTILDEFTINGREKKYVVAAEKPTF